MRKKNRTQRCSPALELLESRRVLAASLGWDGPGLGSAELTYHIANTPSSLSRADTEAAIEAALAAWSGVADISFTQVDTPGLRDSIDISFSPIDGTSGTLAQAYFPDDINPARLAGDIQFDSSELWEVGNALGSRAMDLTWVAVHEIGHALGLEHDSEEDAVLAPFVSTQQVFTGLSQSDVAAIQQLYAPVETAVDATDPSVGDGSQLGQDNTTPTGSLSPPMDTPSLEDSFPEDALPDSEDSPFPGSRWRRGGHWHRWGSRFGAGFLNFNYRIPADVNDDSFVSPLDAMLLIHRLNGNTGTNFDTDLLCDTDGDGGLSPMDALVIINTLNNLNGTSTGSETGDEMSSGSSDPSVDRSDEFDDEVDENSLGNEALPTDVSPGNDADDEQGFEDSEQESEQEDESPSALDEDCDEGPGRHLPTLLTLVPETLLSESDANADGFLSTHELQSQLWNALLATGADSDGDELLSLAEVSTVINAIRQERFDAKDIDSGGFLTESELSSRIWSRVLAADTDEDAQVSFAEFEAWLESGEAVLGVERHLPGLPKAPRAWQILSLNSETLLAAFDTNADELLTMDELPRRIWRSLQRVEADADGDAALSVDEIDSSVLELRQSAFERLDLDADGKVVESEIGTRRWRRLGEADFDSDGALTFDEFTNWLESDELNTPSDLATRGYQPSHVGRGLAIHPLAVDRVFAMIARSRRR